MRPLMRALAVAALLLAIPARPAGAQAGERIDGYQIEIAVEPDGSLAVHEVIRYDFGTNERHGIFRDIRVRYHYDGRYDRVYELDVQSVTASPGTPAEYELEDEGPHRRIRIGDPDRTITGVHSYDIRYRIEGALNHFDDHDELFWDAVGLAWPVPMSDVSVLVRVPARIGQVACFSGPEGSRLPCTSSTSEGQAARFRQGQLGPFEAVTVVVGFPTGVVSTPEPILDERWSVGRAFGARPLTVGLSGGLLALILAGFVMLAWRVGRDRRFTGSPVDVAFGSASGEEQSVPLGERFEPPVEYVPPDGLRPGQVGTIVDAAATPLDVTATIVDLAVRGYLRIDEIPKKGWFGKADWRLVRLRDGDDLLAYERKLFDSLFDDGDEVKLSDLRYTFVTELHEVETLLYRDVLERRWFRDRPDRVRKRWVAIGFVALWAGLLLTIAAAVFTTFGLVPIPIVIGAILLLIGARWMPSRTATGTGVLRRVLGFRRFIEESEAERARFAEQQHLFSEYLPYAIVFGVTEKWARAFAGLDDTLPAMPWYTGPDAFTGRSFVDSMDGFTVTTAGTIASSPSGGSGFGGGGSAGGGGGGGGGGSW